jgi:tetratricopeptide (TPR) repeat protein
VSSHSTFEVVRGIVLLVVAIVAVGWFVVFTIRKAEDPPRMLFKWLITVPVLLLLFFKAAPMVAQGGYGGAFGGVPFTAVCGLALAIIWRRDLAELIANPFASLYSGGNTPPEPRPLYSIAQAKQKQGRYLESVAEIRKQLDRFPTDFEGHMMLAQIQAEDLKDLEGADLTVQHLVAQPGHAPRNIAFALYSLADWYLKVGPDREAARRSLEQVVSLLPETEFALTAAHRIAHLGDAESPLVPHDKKYVVTEGPKNLGLARSQVAIGPVEKEPGQQAVQYVHHLEQHPMDTEAREKLAMIYAEHYGRLDLATDQLEQMIQFPNQPSRLVVRWLNQLADLQIRAGADYDTVKKTLERIIELYPKLAAAETARKRISLLKLELKAKQKNEAVRLGTYEQNIGLKGGSASPHQ